MPLNFPNNCVKLMYFIFSNQFKSAKLFIWILSDSSEQNVGTWNLRRKTVHGVQCTHLCRIRQQQKLVLLKNNKLTQPYYFRYVGSVYPIVVLTERYIIQFKYPLLEIEGALWTPQNLQMYNHLTTPY